VLQVKYLLHLVNRLGVESLDDLKIMLKETGYSDRAINEILKWYKNNNSERRAQ
jgi:hypothetical protein